MDMDTSILFVSFVLGFFLGRKLSNRHKSYFVSSAKHRSAPSELTSEDVCVLINLKRMLVHTRRGKKKELLCLHPVLQAGRLDLTSLAEASVSVFPNRLEGIFF